MRNEQIEFNVISVSHHTPSVIRGDYVEIEIIVAHDRGNQRITMTRFIRPMGRGVDEYRVLKDCWYSGLLEEKKLQYDNRTVKNLTAIDGDFAEYYDPEQEALERQASILAQSDLHTIAPIVAAMLIRCEKGQMIDWKNWLVSYAIECRYVRENITQKYIDMDKESQKGSK